MPIGLLFRVRDERGAEAALLLQVGQLITRLEWHALVERLVVSAAAKPTEFPAARKAAELVAVVAAQHVHLLVGHHRDHHVGHRHLVHRQVVERKGEFHLFVAGVLVRATVRDFQLIPARAEEGAQAGVALDDIAVVVHLLDASRRGARGGVAKLQLGLSAGRESAFGGSPPCLPGWRRGRTRTGACSTPH